MKEQDSSEKQVTHCDLCDKWFCERHCEPKFPYFIDWDTVFDIQGNPEIKLLFHTQYRREDGHPDFIYLRKTVEALEIEEKTRNELIKLAIDRMEEANRKRRIEIRKKKEKEIEAQIAEEEKLREKGKTTTINNKYGHRFVVPREVYLNAEYGEYLNNAQTMKSVNVIVDEYYRKHKKKHWWNNG